MARCLIGASCRQRMRGTSCLAPIYFGLRRLDAEQASDLYEVILERHRRASTIVTSNRTVEEWIPLFDDPVLAQSAMDRLAHNAYQIVMEGDSFRRKLRPGQNPATAGVKSSRSSRRRARTLKR